jgi:sRNA-binding protein
MAGSGRYSIIPHRRMSIVVLSHDYCKLRAERRVAHQRGQASASGAKPAEREAQQTANKQEAYKQAARTKLPQHFRPATAHVGQTHKPHTQTSKTASAHVQVRTHHWHSNAVRVLLTGP